MKRTSLYFFLPFFSFGFLICCSQKTSRAFAENDQTKTNSTYIVQHDGTTLQTRFRPPDGFYRSAIADNSFEDYLRNLPLKPVGAKVKYYDGTVKDKDVYAAVVAMAISKKDLQQCADAVMRLRGEYFYAAKAFEKISFTFTNGFVADYTNWMNGNRVVFNGNTAVWKKASTQSNTYIGFREYMDFVFTYAGTLSLSKSLHPKGIKDMAIGDVFIVGGSPGHAVIVVDMAQNNNGAKVFMLAQSYMPAQETQILKNFNEPGISPWYTLNTDAYVNTPEWRFTSGQLKTW